MSDEARKIIDAALRLSARERELIVDCLQDSLHGEDTRTDIQVTWMQEAALRVERLRNGERQLRQASEPDFGGPHRR